MTGVENKAPHVQIAPSTASSDRRRHFKDISVTELRRSMPDGGAELPSSYASADAGLRDGIQRDAVAISVLKPAVLPQRFALIVVLLTGTSMLAMPSDPPKDARAFVRAVVANELAADANDHSRWMYRDESGVPDKTTVKLVIQTAQGDLSKMVARDGHPLTQEEQKADEQRMDAFVQDANLRQKQKQNHEQDAAKANALTKMLPDAFLWTYEGENGGETTLHFKPDPQFQPPSREARVFAAMEGTMVVNTEQKRIKELKGTLTQDVNFGYGLLGKLEKGGTFQIERQQIAPRIWAITATHVHIHGHALIFKSIGEEQDELTSHYHPTPPSLTLDAAAKMLKDGTAARTLQQ
jgi:hypothetical protein